MAEQQDKICYREPQLDEPKIRAADSERELSAENPSPVPGREKCEAPTSDSFSGTNNESQNKAAKSWSDDPESLSVSAALKLNSAGSGLMRHKLIVAACFCFAATIVLLSTVDMKQLISRAGTIDKNFQATYPIPNPELPPNWSYVQDRETHEGLRPVVQSTWDNDKQGFVDGKGKVAIEPRFSEVGDFHDGLAYFKPLRDSSAAGSTEKPEPLQYGFIDKLGKVVIKPQYDQVLYFDDGVTAVITNNYAALIDANGREIFKSKTSTLPRRFDSAYAVEDRVGKWGLLDKNGKWITPAEYSNIDTIATYNYSTYDPVSARQGSSRTSEILYKVYKDGRSGLIDKDGKIVMPITFDKLLCYKDGYATIETEGLQYVVDQQGKTIIGKGYETLTEYDDVIAARVKDINDFKWILLDSHGKQLPTPTNFDGPVVGYYGQWYSEGLAPVEISGKCGYIDRYGNLKIPAVFDYATAFQDGYAAVWDGTAWRFINHDGKFVSNMRFESASNFLSGKSNVTIPGPLYFLAEQKVIDDQNSSIKNWREQFEKKRTSEKKRSFRY